MPTPKSLNNGRYILEEPIPGGGMGEVYKGRDSSPIDRPVVVKLVRIAKYTLDSNEAQKNALENFKREVGSLARARYGHVVAIYDYGIEKQENDVLAYMVMPYCEEGSLQDWFIKQRAGKPLEVREVVELLTQAGLALEHLHDNGVVHRDVKSTNFLVENRSSDPLALPHLLLADFGLAQTVGEETIQDSRGTDLYKAPEQWDREPLTSKTDQYQLAIMAYYLMTGTHPFDANRDDQFKSRLRHQHRYVIPLAPSTQRADIPPEVDRAILRALAKRPEERYGTVQDFTNAFRIACGLESVSGTVPGRKTGLLGFVPVEKQDAIASSSKSPHLRESFLPRPSMGADSPSGGSRRPIGSSSSRERPWYIAGIVLLLSLVVFAGVYELSRRGAQSSFTPTSIPASTTIEIASDFPTGGLETTTGLPLQNGVEMAINEANNTDMLPGYTLKLTSYDDVGAGNRSDPTMGVMNLSRAITDNLVAGIIGPYYSRVAVEELPIANQNHIALISPSTIYACLTENASDDPNCSGQLDIKAKMRPTGDLTFFRLATTDDREGKAAADYFFNVLHYKSVAIFRDDSDPYIAHLANAFQQEWAQLGGQYTPLAVSQNNSDYQAYQQALQGIRSNPPDLIYYIGSTVNGAYALQALQSLSNIPKFQKVAFAGDGSIVDASFLQAASRINPSAPVYATLPIQDPAHSGVTDGPNFEANYGANSYSDYRQYAASAYAATMILIQAIKTALQKKGVSTPHGALDKDGATKFRRAVLDALADPHFTYTGITGTQSFDANGDTSNHTISFYQLSPSNQQATWIWQGSVND